MTSLDTLITAFQSMTDMDAIYDFTKRNTAYCSYPFSIHLIMSLLSRICVFIFLSFNLHPRLLCFMHISLFFNVLREKKGWEAVVCMKGTHSMSAIKPIPVIFPLSVEIGAFLRCWIPSGEGLGLDIS